jgi:putative ABC transport system permease protein
MKLSTSRAVLRIARRNVARNRWRSALIVVLVLLPVMGMAGGLTLLRTVTPTPEARATNAMGDADLLINRRSAQASTADLVAVLPAGSRVEEAIYSEGAIVLPGRLLRVTERALDLDGLARGALDLVSGRLPGQPDEIATSPAVLAAGQLRVGDTVELQDGQRATIAGVVENPASLNQRLVLRHPSVAGEPRHTADVYWLAALPAGTDLPYSQDERNGALQPDLGPAYDVQTRAMWGGSPASATAGTLLIGALALIETVLVASAAFAVSIRRRQRELGILAAAGAQPRHLAGTVVGEGLVLGGVASLAGAALGVLFVLAASPALDQLTNRRNPPVAIDLLGLALAALIGLAAALLAAAIPAWTAARVPALVALSGRRPPLTKARRILLVGVALITLAVALVAAGASLALAYESRDVGLALLIAGAIVGVLGFGAASPWLIERLDAIGRRLPTSARIAFRDTARARSRSAPIVTAMLSGMAATIAIAASSVSYSAWTAAEWKPLTRPDQLVIGGDDALVAGPAIATELEALAGAQPVSLTGVDGEGASVQVLFSVIGPDAPSWRSDAEYDYVSQVSTGDATLLRALGGEAGMDALESGKIVVLTDRPVNIAEVLVIVERWDEMDPDALPRMKRHVLPAVAVEVGLDPERNAVPGALIPRALLPQLELGVYEQTRSYLIRLDRPVTEGDLARAGSMLAAYGETSWITAVSSPDRTADTLRWVAMALSLLLALSVTAIAVALSEAESRADQRTLLAIGAAPGIRRGIAAGRAGVLAVLAGVLAVPAGLLPAWGLLASREVPLIVPFAEILVAAILLPAAAIVGALLLSRPIPQWSAFRDAAGD